MATQKSAVSKALQDELQLASNPDFLTCVAKEGLGVGGESVVFSTTLQKVNKVGKVQSRVLVLTSGAIYSFKEGKYKKAKRRIPLKEVKAILRGSQAASETFYLHLRSDYDYQYISPKWEELANAICVTVSKVVGAPAAVVAGLTSEELAAAVKTKKAVRSTKGKKRGGNASAASQAALESTNRKIEAMLSRNQLAHLQTSRNGAEVGSLPLTTSTHSTPAAKENSGQNRNLAEDVERRVHQDTHEAQALRADPQFTVFTEGVRKRIAGFVGSYGHSLRTARALQSQFNDVAVRTGNGSGFNGSLERQIDTLVGLFCDLDLLPSFAAFVAAHSKPPSLYQDLAELISRHPDHTLRRWVLLCAWFWICVAAGEKGLLVFGPGRSRASTNSSSPERSSSSGGSRRAPPPARRRSFTMRGAVIAESKFLDLADHCFSTPGSAAFSVEEFDAFVSVATGQRVPPPPHRVALGDGDVGFAGAGQNRSQRVNAFGLQLLHRTLLQRAVEYATASPLFDVCFAARVVQVHAALVARHVRANCHAITNGSADWMAVHWPLLRGLKWPSTQELQNSAQCGPAGQLDSAENHDTRAYTANVVTNLLTYLSTVFTTSLLHSPSRSWKMFRHFTQSIAQYNGWRADGVLLTRKWLQLTITRVGASRTLRAYRGRHVLKLWSAVFILARILEWFVFWYPGRPETDVATCNQGFLLRRATTSGDSRADDFDDFGQTVGIHFDMHATACLDLPLVRSFCAVLNLLELPERGTATLQASDAVTKDAFVMRDFLTSLQASDEVNETAIKLFVATFSARKRHVFDGHHAPAPKPLRADRLKKAMFQVRARNRALRKFTAAMRRPQVRPFAPANAIAEITARLKGALLEDSESGVFPEEMHFVCLGCDEPLMDGANAVQIGDDAAYWHAECFKCTDCGTALKNNQYMLRDEGEVQTSPICVACFTKDQVDEAEPRISTSASQPRCSGCFDSIQAGQLPAFEIQGRLWHKQCALCCSCGKSFASNPEFKSLNDSNPKTMVFVSGDGASLCCSTCLRQQSAQCCGGCHMALDNGEEVVSLPREPSDNESGDDHEHDQLWHADCVACQKCGGRLDEYFSGSSGELYCPSCFRSDVALHCAACDRLCDGYYLEVDGRPLHEGCCTCACCGVQVGGTVHYVDGEIYCADDYSRLFCKTCRRCRNQILDGGIEALGASWHPECLVCSFRGCGRVLSGGSPDAGGENSCFAGENGQPYCEEHVVSATFEVCVACHGPLQDKASIIRVKAESSSSSTSESEKTEDLYHDHCLNCHLCGDNLRERPYYVEAGVIYCQRDFFGQFSWQCPDCLLPVVPGRESMRKVFGDAFHGRCFRCFSCQKQFGVMEPVAQGPVRIPSPGDAGAVETQAAFCRQCHACAFREHCAGCFEPISGGFVKAFPDTVLFSEEKDGCGEPVKYTWHPNCVQCRVCGEALNGKEVFLRENWPVCGGCADRSPEEVVAPCRQATLAWKAAREDATKKRQQLRERAVEMAERHDPYNALPPDDENWLFRDADDVEQGPFSAAQMQYWADVRRLPPSVLVRRAEKPNMEFTPLRQHFGVEE